MKQFLIRTAAVLTAFSAFSGSAAFSAFAAEWKKFFVSVKSVCPNYEPLSDDMMYITPGSHLPVRVEIIQHSPERDPLLLYDKTITGGSAEYTYSFAVERGDYTLRLTYSPVDASKSNNRTVEYKFTMENADYSEEPNQFDKTEMNITLTEKNCKATEKLAPAAGKPADTYKEGVKHQELSVQLDYYTGGRGDYNGDGLTDVEDAQLVLRAYVEQVAGLASEKAPNAMQSVICDINGDGSLTVEDAQYILKWYTANIAGLNAVWPDGVEEYQSVIPTSAT